MSQDKPYFGMWDYDGALDPLKGRAPSGMQSFTLGCFQWVRRRNGKGPGLKPGKVQHRIKGDVSNPHEAHRKAKAFCDQRNEFPGPPE